MSDDSETIPTIEQPVHAKALRNTFHFWKFLVMGLVVFGFAGCAFLFDGFYRYPKKNREIDQLDAEIVQKEKAGVSADELAPLRAQRKKLGDKSTPTSINTQIAIGTFFTPLGLWMLYRHFRATRGEYRLENDIVTVPGHPPIPVDSITAIRNAKWMTKGLASFDYKTPDGKAGTMTLDALAYESKPADAIHDTLVKSYRARTGDTKVKFSAPPKKKDELA